MQTATMYYLVDFEGSREGEDKERWREERKEEGKGGEKGGGEEERVRKEGDEQVAGTDNMNDIIMMS